MGGHPPLPFMCSVRDQTIRKIAVAGGNTCSSRQGVKERARFTRSLLVYYIITWNKLASLAHSIYTCLKYQFETSAHVSDNCTLGSKVV